MPDELILVAGASGALGSVLVRRLLASGYPVRALGRNPRKLAMLGVHGAEPFVADMLDRGAMDEACAGVSQVVSTANNILGRGRTSCNRIDEEMYRTSGAAAKAAGVGRWVHISARDLAPDSPVDYFRVKHRVEAIVRGFDVPWVVIRPSAYIDIWMGVLFGDAEKPKKVATVFGDGKQVIVIIFGK